MASEEFLQKHRHIHFTGIKGVAMAALALCARDLDIKVTGSDIEEHFVTDETLKKHGIEWKIGFKKENLENPQPDLVITTGAHGGLNNPEVLAAKDLGIPVLTHAEGLGKFIEGKDLITVCGVGGKTTTSSMVATLLSLAGKNPSFAVGVGDIFALGTPGCYNKEGEYFVTEADEFAVSPGIDNRPRFTYQDPKILIVPNIEHDHPDIYPTFEDTKKVFLEFFEKVPNSGALIAGIDNNNVRTLIKETNAPVQTYGLAEDADWKVEDISYEEGQTKFVIKNDGNVYNFVLKVPGLFNVLNATAAVTASHLSGIPMENLPSLVEQYTGCERRVEKVWEEKGIILYDDYAHHPTEIKAVLKAFRDWYPNRRIVTVFQPHTYSRTHAMFSEFSQSFKDADQVFLMDIYASARETETLGVSSQLLAEETAKHHPNVTYSGNHSNTISSLASSLQPGDVIVTLGAGDIFHMHDSLKSSLPNET